MTFVVPQIPRLFDVTRVELPNGATILPALEPVLAADPVTASPVPNIAKSFRRVDPTTYEFVIRDGVTFWNGDPLLPSDVAFSMSLHGEQANQSNLFAIWNGAKVKVDGSKLTVSLRAPDSNFIYGVTQTGVIQEKFWKDAGGTIGTPATLNLGTGPLKVTSFSPERSAEFVLNESYWGAKPAIEKLTIETIDDENTALSAAQAGEFSGTFAVAAARLPDYEAIETMATTVVPEPAVITTFFNPTIEPFDDIHVRRAIAMSIDKEGINQSLYGGAATGAASLVAPFLLEQIMPKSEIDGFLAPLGIPYDPEQAEAELARSRVPDGFEYEVVTASYDPLTLQIGLILADSLKQLGITLNVKQLPAGQYDDAVFFPFKQTQGMGIINYGVSAFTPINTSVAMLSPENLPPEGYTNIAGFRSAAVGRIVRQLGEIDLTIDKAQVSRLLQELLEINSNEVIYAPIVFGQQILALEDSYLYKDFSAAWNLAPWYKQVSAA